MITTRDLNVGDKIVYKWPQNNPDFPPFTRTGVIKQIASNGWICVRHNWSWIFGSKWIKISELAELEKVVEE